MLLAISNGIWIRRTGGNQIKELQEEHQQEEQWIRHTCELGYISSCQLYIKELLLYESFLHHQYIKHVSSWYLSNANTNLYKIKGVRFKWGPFYQLHKELTPRFQNMMPAQWTMVLFYPILIKFIDNLTDKHDCYPQQFLLLHESHNRKCLLCLTNSKTGNGDA